MGFKLREISLPILPKGSNSLRVLHFSDLHLTPRRHRLVRDIQSWHELNPDLVISTGDFLASPAAIETTLTALAPLLDRPGLYVFGSNDYYGPRIKNPFSYLKRDDGTRKLGATLPVERLDNGLTKGAGEPYLHVSAGMGYNPYTPIRLFAPPEVSLITLRQIR
jgi:predicted MPP superfamily phosphohydrolase